MTGYDRLVAKLDEKVDWGKWALLVRDDYRTRVANSAEKAANYLVPPPGEIISGSWEVRIEWIRK